MDDVETRTVMSLRTGTKICVLIGLAFIVLAVYFFVVPITSVRTTSGAVFGCGSAMSPAHGSFADGVCWRIADANRYRAYAALAIGIVTIIAGVLLFGVDRREEQRRLPRDHHDFESEETEAADVRRDQDWHGDEPLTRRDRFAAERDDRPESTRSARRRDDGYQPYNDGDDDQSSRRETDSRYANREDDRYGRRDAPGQH
jgi:Na+/proline symporter